MILDRDRVALAKTLVGLVAVIVVIVGAAVVYPIIGLGSPANSTTGASTLSGSSSAAHTSSSSQVTAEPFHFALINRPDVILVSPGANLTYPRINVLSLPSPQPSGTELVTLSVVAPSGISIHLRPNTLNISINSQLSLQGSADPPFSLSSVAADSNVAPGDYKVTVVGTSGSFSATNSLTIRVVQYLVIASNKVFTPSQLTVKAGSTVYWLNLGMPVGNDRQEYDVSIGALNVQSTTLVGGPFFDSFSYTFTTPGTYQYFCVQNNDCSYPYMSGVVTVTA